MSHWRHRICADCYIDREIASDPNDHGSGQAVIRIPFRVSADACPAEGDCCFCGVTIHNTSGHGGIYVRHDPEFLECGGEHADGY